MLPLALTVMVVAPLSSRVVERIGTKIVVSSGLALVALSLVLQGGLGTSSSYGDVVWRMVLLAVGMGMTMAPATESIMGSLPLAKAGVGSAMNDTTRQVGGALGIAVIGSVLSSVYGSKIVDAITGKAPPEMVELARESLGGALEIASHAGPDGAGLAALARSSFVDAMHTGSRVAAGAAALGAIVTSVFLPARARPDDLELQHEEYERELATETETAPSSHGAVQQTAGEWVGLSDTGDEAL